MGHLTPVRHLPSVTHIAVEDPTTRDSTVVDTILHRAAQGDEAAFDQLVLEHHAAMSRVAFVICGDDEAGRDAVQIAWSIAWRRLPTLRDHSQVRPWLVAIAANEARQALRRQRRRPVVDISAELIHSPVGDPADAIELVDLQRALARLDPDDRQLLALRFVAGFDSTELARHLGGSASGIRSRVARLVDRLRMDIDHE